MYALRKTLGRRIFKDLLGQANHFLITVLVGLDGVNEGAIEKRGEFSTAWNPRDVKRSAARSRLFVLDLGLIRAIDALDTYMMRSVRKPSAIGSEKFQAAMDGTVQSVHNRLLVFDAHLPSLPCELLFTLELAIQWRNKRVHSLETKDKLGNEKKKALREQAEYFRTEYSGLEIDDLIKNFEKGNEPTFKEAASVIRMCHRAVEHYDGHLLKQLDVEKYIQSSVIQQINQDGLSVRSFCTKTWSRPNSAARAKRVLRFVGVSEVTEISGREVPDSFVDQFQNMTLAEAIVYLSE